MVLGSNIASPLFFYQQMHDMLLSNSVLSSYIATNLDLFIFWSFNH